jgi:hypothetical protein
MGDVEREISRTRWIHSGLLPSLLAVIKNEVWEAVEDSRKFKKFLPAFNATFLTLIPKEEK